MKNELFKTEEDIHSAVAHFKTLKKHAGWKILEEIVLANIEELKNQILEGFENETKEQIDRKRDKLKAYEEVIGTPDYWIETLSSPEPFVEDADPYFTKESLKKSRS